MSLFGRAKNRMMRVSRERKLEHFYRQFCRGMTVLDVGVAAESAKSLPAQNYFLKNFRFDLQYYTGLGIQDLSTTQSKYPGARLVRYSGGKFPFADREFDWVFSNAVIEHVGDEQAQLQFLNEMMRVARNVFFTTPNKYFPVESHTNVLFLHWNKRLFYSWCRAVKHPVRPEDLSLLSSGRLKQLLDISSASRYEIRNNRVLGLPMTFTVICEGRFQEGAVASALSQSNARDETAPTSPDDEAVLGPSRGDRGQL